MSVVYRFGPFHLDTAEGTLTRNGNRVKLQDLPYRLLVMLLEQPGQIISREAVRQRLWPENTFVEFDNSLGVAVRKIRDALDDAAEAPRYLETLPRKGYRFLAPVSVAEPEIAQHEENHLAPSSVQAAPLQASAKSAGRTNHLYLYSSTAALAVLLIVAAIWGFHASRKHPPQNSASLPANAPVLMRKSVAVIGFRNLPGHPEDNWLSLAFAEMLNTELAADSALRMVSGEDVARAKRELPLGEDDSLATATLQRLRTDPGADVVVLGAYTLLHGTGEKRIRLDVRLQDTARGETIAEQAFVGNEDNLFELVSEAGASLRKSLGSPAVSSEVSAQVRAALPSKSLAVRLYTEGRARLWAFDFVGARDLLIQAVSVEPEFPLSHAALADAWNHLGFSPKARDEAQHAFALSDHLGPEERLLVQGQHYSIMEDRNNAIAVFQKLFTEFPDNIDYGLRLAEEQRWIKPEAAMQTVASLRRLPAPAGEDARIDVMEARVWINLDLSKVEPAARRAIEKGNRQGSRLLVARAYGILCQASGSATSSAEAIHDCETARQGYAAAGDSDNEARALSDTATLYYQRGDLDGSEKLMREAIPVFRRIGDVQGVTTVSSNLGDIFLARARLDDAERALSDALPGYREIGDKDGVALTLNDLGQIAELRGDLASALHSYEQGKLAAQEIDDNRALAYLFTGIGDALADRGDFAKARKSYDQGLSLRKQTGEKQTVPESELAIARLSILEGHAADAESVIRKCKDQFHQDQGADDELAASVALLDALLTQSKHSEAAKEAQETKSLAAKSANRLLQLESELVLAREEGESGQAASASARLADVVRKARSLHLLPTEFRATLAAAELKIQQGQNSAGKADLIALEKSARGKDFYSIADKARSLSDRRR